jgi:hypothetical protein
MKLNDPIGNATEAIMSATTISDTTTRRYGYAPQVMFAATLAGAERRAREAAAAAASDARESHSARSLIRRLTTRRVAS